MKRIFFSLIAVLAAVSGFSCKDEPLRDHALLRRLRLRNTAEAVSQDFADALRSGDTARLFALSVPSVRCKLDNELHLVFPHLSDAERLQAYALSLKLKYGNTPLLATPIPGSAASPGEEAKVRFFRIASPDSAVSGHLLELRCDRYGNWKNVSRL